MFWDSSALVPVVLPQSRSGEVALLLSKDPGVAIWWATPTECQSALYKRHRQVPIAGPLLRQALQRIDAVVDDVDTVVPTEQVRQRARRLLAAHALRAADALQLAAALTWCKESPARECFVCLDARLVDAASKEGFQTAP